ncbi:uncharacterized protein [Centroberyx affinis]|uniref:uncharacterized protein n=1 Tax=Centroberyx affinis TaxID=166261 RepID=UPI003A5C3F1F
MDRTVQLALLCLQACLLISAFTSPDTQTDALLKENPLSSDSMVDEITTERPVEMEKDLDKVARGCYLRPGACGPLTKNPRTKRQVETRPAPRRARKGKRKRPANRPGAIGLSGHKGARPINHIGGGSVVGLAGPVEDHIPNHHSEKPSVVACFGEDHIHHPEQEGAVRLSGVRKRHKQKSRPGSGSNIALTDIDQKATPDDTNTRAYW